MTRGIPTPVFLQIGPLHALAPTQSEPPFAIAQGAALVGFVVLGWRRFRSPFTPTPAAA
jgi:hypothetical protein